MFDFLEQWSFFLFGLLCYILGCSLTSLYYTYKEIKEDKKSNTISLVELVDSNGDKQGFRVDFGDGRQSYFIGDIDTMRDLIKQAHHLEI